MHYIDSRVCIYLSDGISVFVIESAPCKISAPFVYKHVCVYTKTVAPLNKKKERKIYKNRFTLGSWEFLNKQTNGSNDVKIKKNADEENVFSV